MVRIFFSYICLRCERCLHNVNTVDYKAKRLLLCTSAFCLYCMQYVSVDTLNIVTYHVKMLVPAPDSYKSAVGVCIMMTEETIQYVCQRYEYNTIF